MSILICSIHFTFLWYIYDIRHFQFWILLDHLGCLKVVYPQIQSISSSCSLIFHIFPIVFHLFPYFVQKSWPIWIKFCGPGEVHFVTRRLFEILWGQQRSFLQRVRGLRNGAWDGHAWCRSWNGNTSDVHKGHKGHNTQWLSIFVGNLV